MLSHAKISIMPVRTGWKLEIQNYDEKYSPPSANIRQQTCVGRGEFYNFFGIWLFIHNFFQRISEISLYNLLTMFLF